MKQLIFICIALFIFSCGTEQKEESKIEESTTSIPDSVPRVTGIGGIFFRSEDPGKLNSWYGDNLGMAMDDYGSPFEFRDARDPNKRNYLRWSVFPEQTEYLGEGKSFMINYRVNNIVGLVAKLKANGVTVLDSIETYPYGKFVHIMDPDSNRIELWEPVDEFFTEMGGETTK